MVAVLLAWGCAEARLERWPGPHEDERGLVTVWEVEEAWAETHDCTFDLGERMLERYPPEGSAWVAYRLDEQGETAADLDCGMLRDDYCHETGRSWTVNGEVLWTETDDLGAGGLFSSLYESCHARAVGQVRLRDAGDRAVLTIDAQMTYEGNVCGEWEVWDGLGCGGVLTLGLTHRATF